MIIIARGGLRSNLSITKRMKRCQTPIDVQFLRPKEELDFFYTLLLVRFARYSTFPVVANNHPLMNSSNDVEAVLQSKAYFACHYGSGLGNFPEPKIHYLKRNRTNNI